MAETEVKEGNNAVGQDAKYVHDPKSIKAQLAAQVAEGAKLVKPIEPGEETTGEATATATDEAPKQTETTPQDGKKVDSLQQFRNKDGEVDENKIKKSNEHLEKAIGTKEERLSKLLETNKELLRKHTKVSQEIKSLEKGEVKSTEAAVENSALDPETKKKLLEELEKDPVAAIYRITEMASQRGLSPLQRDLQEIRESSRNDTLVGELDRLGQNGHPWVYTQEGRERFDAFFSENPWVLNSKRPYTDAIKLMGIQESGVDGEAQTVKAPTLGAFHAAPPPVSSKPATPESDMVTLSRDLKTALSLGDLKAAKQIRAKMEVLHRDIMPDTM